MHHERDKREGKGGEKEREKKRERGRKKETANPLKQSLDSISTAAALPLCSLLRQRERLLAVPSPPPDTEAAPAAGGLGIAHLCPIFGGVREKAGDSNMQVLSLPRSPSET